MASGASRRAAESREKKPAAANVVEAAGDSRPELVDATRYDFDRLEAVVTDLVERHRALQGENSKLRQLLGDRVVYAKRLEADIEDLQSRRERSQARLDQVIAHLDRMEAALGEPSAGKNTRARSQKPATAAGAGRKKAPRGR